MSRTSSHKPPETLPDRMAQGAIVRLTKERENMSTQAKRAFEEFAAAPLVKACGVDRASWIAGYETALVQQDKLLDTLRNARSALVIEGHHTGLSAVLDEIDVLLAKIKEEV